MGLCGVVSPPWIKNAFLAVCQGLHAVVCVPGELSAQVFRPAVIAAWFL